MTRHVEELIEAFRVELQHHGELLALLEANAEGTALLSGLPNVVGAALDVVRRQSAALAEVRRQRLKIQSHLAWAIQRPREESLRKLLPDLPPDYQPLLLALADEVEDLMSRVRECARLNRQHLHNVADQLEGLIDAVAASTGEERPVPQSVNA